MARKITDKMRLDWLIEAVDGGGSIHTEGVNWVATDGGFKHYENTPRKAIDAAIQAIRAQSKKARK